MAPPILDLLFHSINKVEENEEETAAMHEKRKVQRCCRHTPAIRGTRNWEFGPKLQTRGSIHSDVWSGSAAQLAKSKTIAIFPVMGWWREQPALDCVDNDARYSLVVTISTESTDLPLYEMVEREISIAAATEVIDAMS